MAMASVTNDVRDLTIPHNGDAGGNVIGNWLRVPFKFVRDYFNSSSYSIVGKVSWSLREGTTSEYLSCCRSTPSLRT